MPFVAILLAVAFASEDSETLPAPVTSYVAPWEIELMKADDRCTQLCQEWSALYFSLKHGCVGHDVDGPKVFCPDTEVVEEWTVDDEREYEAMHSYSGQLDISEREMFRDLTSERTMKISVHPWINHLPEHGVSDARRRMGSSTIYTCHGGNGGGEHSYEQDVKPYAMSIRHGALIEAITFEYANGDTLTGGGNGGDLSYEVLPDCINVVVLRSMVFLDSIQFIGNGEMTERYGGYGGGLHVIVAPTNKCLGDIKIRSGTLIDKICLKFNVEVQC